MSHQDLEVAVPATERRSSWLTGPSMTFRRSRSFTEKNATQRAPTWDGPGPAPVILTDNELQRQDSVLIFIVGDQIVKGSLAASCVWYVRYLQSKFIHHWHLLAPALNGLDDASTHPRPGDLVVVYDFLLSVARLLKTRKDLALVEIVDELDNHNLLKPQLDEERAIPNQVVFAALGWLTMLYDAVSHPKPDKLEVTKTSTSSSGYRNPLVTRKYCNFKQGFDYIDLPLFSLLGRYGDLIPEARQYQVLEPGISGALAHEVIKVPTVCFNTLHNMAELKIEWVTSLALHLELDSGKKTLKLFQFPSFCRMMFVKRKNNILSRLLNDHAARNCEDVRTPDIATEDFFREILLSYRLIFGQDERSWKAFSRMVPIWEEQRSRVLWETSWDCDPMLHVLCGKSSSAEDAQRIYDDVNANEPANYYDPNTQFPFLGKKLVELQGFIMQHQPQNVRSLLNDRRDVAAWYTLWNNQLLIFFATCTIFLMVLSLIFQIWQVLLAKEQLKLGPA